MGRRNGSDKGPLRRIVGWTGERTSLGNQLELECGHVVWSHGAMSRVRCRHCKLAALLQAAERPKPLEREDT